MAEQAGIRWSDVLRPVIACQRSLTDSLEAVLREIEEALEAAGDDAQLANVDLQTMVQKQQQTVQMLSQIAKVLHDTAMAIIRKMGD